MPAAKVDNLVLSYKGDRRRALVGISGCTPDFANVIRRTTIADVKSVVCPAMDDDESYAVTTNTSRLNTELLITRIGLVPIHVNEAEQIDWEAPHGSKWGPYTFGISVKVDNNRKEDRKVTSKDIQVYDAATGAVQPAEVRDRLFPPCPLSGDHILIVELFASAAPNDPPEEVNLTFKARAGCGRENSRWNPVSECFSVYRVDPKRYEADLAAKLKDLPIGEHEQFKQQFATLDGLRSFVADANDNPIAFDLTVFSEVGRSPVQLVDCAIKAVIAKTKAFLDKLEKLDDNNDISNGNGNGNADVLFESTDEGHMITVHGEDHTLGSLVQDRLFHRWIVDEDKRAVEYVGYVMRHPLERTIVFKWKTAEGAEGSKGSALATFIEAVKGSVIAYLEDFKKSWDSAAAAAAAAAK